MPKRCYKDVSHVRVEPLQLNKRHRITIVKKVSKFLLDSLAFREEYNLFAKVLQQEAGEPTILRSNRDCHGITSDAS